MYRLVDYARMPRVELPSETVAIIARLAAAVGAEIALPKFPTKTKQKLGPEKTLADIQACLNKLSQETMAVQSPKLCELIMHLEDPVLGANLILDTASQNSFYSILYAKILKTLTHAPIQASIKVRSAAHAASVNDGTGSKAFTIFLASAVSVGLLPKEFAASFVASLQEQIRLGMHDNASKDRNDAMVEHVEALAAWLPAEDIAAMTRVSPTECPGISYKTLFKYMDLQEKNTQKKIAWK